MGVKRIFRLLGPLDDPSASGNWLCIGIAAIAIKRQPGSSYYECINGFSQDKMFPGKREPAALRRILPQGSFAVGVSMAKIDERRASLSSLLRPRESRQNYRIRRKSIRSHPQFYEGGWDVDGAGCLFSPG